MNDDNDNVVLKHLIQIREELADMRKEVRGLDSTVSHLSLAVAGLQIGLTEVRSLARDTHAEVVGLAGRLREIDKIADLERRVAALEATAKPF